jgi:plasmid stabilization system protein ParE
MIYSVIVTASAKSDIRETACWLGEQASPTVAERWLAGLRKSINTLTSHPRRCPLAAESDKFPVEVRGTASWKVEDRKISHSLPSRRRYRLYPLRPPRRAE